MPRITWVLPGMIWGMLLWSATAPAAEQATELKPITVEGEKTARSLQDTATSVSVLTGEELAEDGGTETLDEAISNLPNVIDVGTGNLAPTIRGSDTTGPTEGSFAFIAGTRPRVTIQRDGRPLTYNEYVFGRAPLWDVERVEVLRGPQTTLQGRNSIAGAIIVDTKDPVFRYETAGRLITDSADSRQVSGMVSGPIVTDELAFRLSADRREHESWVELTGPPDVDDPRQETSTDIRGKLLYLPAALPDLSAKLTLNLVEARRPQTEYVQAPFGKRRHTTFPGSFPVFDTQSHSAIAEVAYTLAPGWELRNTTVYADIEVKRRTRPNSGIADIDGEEYSNELIASYQAPGGGARWVLGSYLFHAESDEWLDISGNFDDETDTAAVFGEATLTFFRALDVTLGARYEREQRERSGGMPPFVLDLDETYDAFLPKLGVAYRASERFTYGATIQRGWNAGGAGVAFAGPDPVYTYDEEYVWNYELFFRSDWLDNRLRVNGNLFYADHEDQQRTAFLVPGDPFSGVIRNVDAAVSYGAELTATWLASRGLELYGGLGLLATEIERFDASVLDLDGNEFARAPDVNLTLGARYEHAAGWSLGARGRFVDDYYSDDEHTPGEHIDSYALLDLDAGYRVDPRTRVFAYVDNVFDSDAELLIFNGNAQLVDPREFGIGVAFNLD